MTTITYHHTDGHTDVLDVPSGMSLMRAAVSNGIDGIIGECGGQAMCATCHVLVRDEYVAKLPPISEDEDEMLDCTTTERDPIRSRLGCQIKTGVELDAIEVDIPETQA